MTLILLGVFIANQKRIPLPLLYLLERRLKGGHLSLISTSRSLPHVVGQNYGLYLAARGQLLDICPDLDIHGTISDVLTLYWIFPNSQKCCKITQLYCEYN
jgi:hypothetical protein